jgi:hypothetical protein
LYIPVRITKTNNSSSSNNNSSNNMKTNGMITPDARQIDDPHHGFRHMFLAGSPSVSGRSPSSEARRGGINGAQLLAILDEALALTDESLAILDACSDAPGFVGDEARCSQ